MKRCFLQQTFQGFTHWVGGVIIKIVQVIVAKLMMTLSLASLLLNNCCVLEDLAPFRFRTVPAEEMLLQDFFLTKNPFEILFLLIGLSCLNFGELNRLLQNWFDL